MICTQVKYKMLIFSRLFLCSLIFYQVLGTEVDFLDLYGDVTYSITKESSDTETITCTAEKDDSGQMGTFLWFKSDVEIDPVTEEGEDPDEEVYYSKYKYLLDLKDNDKELTCQYTPSNGGEMGEKSLKLKIQKHIIPQSPYVLETAYKIGDSVNIPIEMDLYPKPEAKNLVWIIEDPQQVEEKIELEPGQASGSYSASELVEIGDDKFTYRLIIDSLSEEDFKKNIYFLLKANTDRKVDVALTRDPIEVTTVLPPKSTGMGAGLWVIVILVLLIILACIGYCIWQRWGRKKTTQEQDQEKGDFQQVPQNDTK